MLLHGERMLLNLSLEFAAAKEPLAAIEIFGRYLQERFQPVASEIKESNEVVIPLETIFFQASANKQYVLLPLTIPKIFILENSKNEVPTDNEIAIWKKIVQSFREKHEAMLELKGLTYTDDLTGLYNQRYLELILDRELALARRSGTPFSILFLDLDHFKNINDSHGHLIGSRLLYEVGLEIKRALRESDITFRYGGDEFVMVLATTNLQDALLVAERIRVQIEKKRFLAREKLDIRLTASIGVASFPEHGIAKADILRAADEALYGVKKDARNKVIAAVLKINGRSA